MKNLKIFGSLLIVLIFLASCKKEIIQPNSHSTDVVSAPTVKKSAKTNCTSSDGSVGVDGTITDPNDDDYTRKNAKQKKN